MPQRDWTITLEDQEQQSTLVGFRGMIHLEGQKV